MTPIPPSLVDPLPSTTTTAVFSWKGLPSGQSLSSLCLHSNAHTPSLSFHTDPSELLGSRSHKVKGLPPGTSFKAKLEVATYLAHLNVTLKQVTEQTVELRWGDLSPLDSLEPPRSPRGPPVPRGEAEERRGGVGPWRRGACVPVSLSSRGVTVARLSPGRVFSFSLRASHSAGFSWSLGRMRTAYTSEFFIHVISKM
ncbi:unnamed protein product [Merluccius merluccius]